MSNPFAQFVPKAPEEASRSETQRPESASQQNAEEELAARLAEVEKGLAAEKAKSLALQAQLEKDQETQLAARLAAVEKGLAAEKEKNQLLKTQLAVKEKEVVTAPTVLDALNASERQRSKLRLKPFLALYEDRLDVQKQVAARFVEPGPSVSAEVEDTESRMWEMVSGQILRGEWDPMAAMLLHFLTDRATRSERVLMMKALASGNAGRIQLVYSTLILSKSGRAEDILEDTSGGALATPYPLLHEYVGCPQRVNEVNAAVLARSNPAGGGSSLPTTTIEKQSDCHGFSQWRRTLPTGAGTMPVITLQDGSMAVDTAPLEEYITRMEQWVQASLQPVLQELDRLKQKGDGAKAYVGLEEALFKALNRMKRQVSTMAEQAAYRGHRRTVRGRGAEGDEMEKVGDDYFSPGSF